MDRLGASRGGSGGANGVAPLRTGGAGTSPKVLPRSPSPSVTRVVKKSTPLKLNGDGGSPSSLTTHPLKLELDRRENDLRVKDVEFEKQAAELKTLKQVQLGKDKAIAALQAQLEKYQEKLSSTERQLDEKILELKKANDQKKAAFSTQAAAEAIARRLQATQKDSPGLSVEMVLAPVEAQLKLTQKEVAELQDNLKAQDRLMRAKEAALLEADKKVEAAEAKAAQVEGLLNVNRDLVKQLEAKEDENKVVDKMYKQKVDEVKKLTEQTSMLEEALTAAGAAASTIKDYQRQMQELQVDLKVNQEELARAKVAANRVATVIANEWKDEEHRVIPIKQYLEERRHMQGEAQALKEKVALAERSARYESQMKEKYQLRLKVLEEGVKAAALSREVGRRLTTGSMPEKLTPSTSPVNGSEHEEHSSVARLDEFLTSGPGVVESLALAPGDVGNGTGHGGHGPDGEEVVSEAVYNLLQREVVSLRKMSTEKDQGLKDKDDAIEMLSKKVEVLSRAMETEAKKCRRELTGMEKELASLKSEASDGAARRRSIGTAAKVAAAASTPRKPVLKT